jgi:hypothetical protein
MNNSRADERTWTVGSYLAQIVEASVDAENTPAPVLCEKNACSNGLVQRIAPARGRLYRAIERSRYAAQ